MESDNGFMSKPVAALGAVGMMSIALAGGLTTYFALTVLASCVSAGMLWLICSELNKLRLGWSGVLIVWVIFLWIGSILIGVLHLSTPWFGVLVVAYLQWIVVLSQAPLKK